MFRHFMNTTEKQLTLSRRSGLTRICLAVGLLAAGALSLSFGPNSSTKSKVVSSQSKSETARFRADESQKLVADSFVRHNERSVSRSPERIRSRDPDRFAAADNRFTPEMIDRRISDRYGNSTTGRFLNSISTDESLQMYLEASRMIDQRHLEPASYAKRVRQALVNLSYAADNPEFLRANQISPTERQVNDFRNALESLYRTHSVNSAGDALNMVYRVMNPASRHLGLNLKTVALEFINGSTESLDKYSAFVPDDVAKAPSASLNESIVGIGAEIETHALGVRVVKPLRGGPAEGAGLRKGDIITTINGESLAGRSLNFAVGQIAGPAGTHILLSILRNEAAITPVAIVRRQMRIPSVSEVRMLASNAQVGYIKLDQFTQTSDEEMDEALWSLHRQGMQSLVFDLRGNPGGLLTTAVSLSNKFLPCGSIVSTRGRTVEDQMSESATYAQTWKVPLVVLVDEMSASASEIFAAAIQENERGLIVGRKSYGKGTVQTHFPMRTVSGTLRLTTARFYSPNGRKMAGAGVEPDIAIDLSSDPDDAMDVVLNAAVENALSGTTREMAQSKTDCKLPHRHPGIVSG